MEAIILTIVGFLVASVGVVLMLMDGNVRTKVGFALYFVAILILAYVGYSFHVQFAELPIVDGIL